MQRKQQLKASVPSKAKFVPLKAQHAIHRPTTLNNLNKGTVGKVCLLSRKLNLLPPGRGPSMSDERLVEFLLTPSPSRFQLLCEIYCGFCPELKSELEDLRPLPKMTLEETKHNHILKFVHDAGIFEEGDEADMAKIKGDVSAEKHLDFWLENLKLATMLGEWEEANAPKLTSETLLEEAEMVTEQMELLNFLQTPDTSLVSGPLLEHVEKKDKEKKDEDKEKKDKDKEYSIDDLKRIAIEVDGKMIRLQNVLDEFRENSESLEEPPESIVDDEALTKIKLSQGNLRDKVNTFLMKFALALKNIVEENSHPVESCGELEDLLDAVFEETENLEQFMPNAIALLDRFDSLKAAQSNAKRTSNDFQTLIAENHDALALNPQLVLPVGVGPSRGPGVWDEFFKDL